MCATLPLRTTPSSVAPCSFGYYHGDRALLVQGYLQLQDVLLVHCTEAVANHRAHAADLVPQAAVEGCAGEVAEGRQLRQHLVGGGGQADASQTNRVGGASGMWLCGGKNQAVVVDMGVWGVRRCTIATQVYGNDMCAVPMAHRPDSGQ